MSAANLSSLSIDEILALYLKLCVARGVALDLTNGPETDRLSDRIYRLNSELRDRPGDQRRVLFAFLANENAHVRYMAATALFDVVPADARRVLEDIAEHGQTPLAGHAGMYLSMRDSGFLK